MLNQAREKPTLFSHCKGPHLGACPISKCPAIPQLAAHTEDGRDTLEPCSALTPNAPSITTPCWLCFQNAPQIPSLLATSLPQPGPSHQYVSPGCGSNHPIYLLLVILASAQSACCRVASRSIYTGIRSGQPTAYSLSTASAMLRIKATVPSAAAGLCVTQSLLWHCPQPCPWSPSSRHLGFSSQLHPRRFTLFSLLSPLSLSHPVPIPHQSYVVLGSHPRLTTSPKGASLPPVSGCPRLH